MRYYISSVYLSGIFRPLLQCLCQQIRLVPTQQQWHSHLTDKVGRRMTIIQVPGIDKNYFLLVLRYFLSFLVYRDTFRIRENCPCLLAHLSRRLIGELIVYPCSGVRRCCCYRRRRSQFSNIFSSETSWQIRAKFYSEPPWEGGIKVCINCPGHKTKMAATPIYCKNL